MHFTLSKALKLGGFRLGAGLRITKKNALWMPWVVMMVCVFQLCWYMMVLCFWVIYAVCYGMIWCIRGIFRAIRRAAQKIQSAK